MLARLLPCQRQMKTLRKIDKRMTRTLLEYELSVAWRERRMYNVWAIARRLAGNAEGVKSRGVHSGLMPTPEQWKIHNEKPGHLGGNGASMCSLSDIDNETTFTNPSPTDNARADKFISEVAQRLAAMPRRKSVASHEVPVELWQLALATPRLHIRTQAIGAPLSSSTSPPWLLLSGRRCSRSRE